jgi:uncharacterized RDD family membrane protein YckC
MNPSGAEAFFPLPGTPAQAVPSIRRRMAAFTYEALILFALLMLSGWLFSTLAQQRHALLLRQGLMWYSFIVLAVYFVWFWTHGGQTVAMRAWHIKVVTATGQPLTQARAMARYVLCYAWLLPGLAVAHFSQLQGAALLMPVALNIVGWALVARFTPGRQFMHDKLCGTQLITQLPDKPKAASNADGHTNVT